MTREEKSLVIDNLTAQLAENNVIYVAGFNWFERSGNNGFTSCLFQSEYQISSCENTLLSKAMEASEKEFGELPSILKGNTSLMYAEVGNVPAKLIKEFRKKSDKPILKGAYVDAAVFIGDSQLDALAALKSKNEVIGDINRIAPISCQKTLFQLSNQVAANWLVSSKLYLKSKTEHTEFILNN